MINHLQHLADFLLTRGVTRGMLDIHRETLITIAASADGELPGVIRHMPGKFALEYSCGENGREIRILLSKLTKNDVVVYLGSAENPMKGLRSLIREAFGWLYEGRPRTNRAKLIVDDLEAKHEPPYTAVGFWRQDRAKEVLPIAIKDEKSLKGIYDRFRKIVPADVRCVIYVRIGSDTDAKLANVLEIDTQVLEKAFYFGDGPEQPKEPLTKRFAKRFSNSGGIL